MEKTLTKEEARNIKVGECFNLLSRAKPKQEEAKNGAASVGQDSLKLSNLEKDEMSSSNAENEIVAIPLLDCGFLTVVLTSMEDIYGAMKEVQILSAGGWSKSDREGMYKKILEDLQCLEELFRREPKLVERQSPDWMFYCDGCVLLYVLDAYMTNKPFNILHPQAYASLIADGAIDLTSGLVPYFNADVS